MTEPLSLIQVSGKTWADPKSSSLTSWNLTTIYTIASENAIVGTF